MSLIAKEVAVAIDSQLLHAQNLSWQCSVPGWQLLQWHNCVGCDARTAMLRGTTQDRCLFDKHVDVAGAC